MSVAVLLWLTAYALTWNVADAATLLPTLRVALATPPTVEGATGATVAAAAGLTSSVTLVPLGAGLLFTNTFTRRPSEAPASSTLLLGRTKFTPMGAEGTGAGAGVGAGAGAGAGTGVLFLSVPPPQPARAAVKASRVAMRCLLCMGCMVL